MSRRTSSPPSTQSTAAARRRSRPESLLSSRREWRCRTIQIGDTVITGLHGVCEPDLERPVDGAGVAASGYPLQNSALVTNAGGIASAWLTDREAAALLRLEDPHTRESADRYLADLEVNGGNSGGPVYRVDTGRVIGVCRATQSAPVTFGDEEGGAVIPEGRGPLVYSSGLTVVVPAKYVAKFLHENGLAWRREDGDQPAIDMPS
jgi:hypothetical protein